MSYMCKCLWRPSGVEFPGTKFTTSYKLPGVDARNQTRVHCLNSPTCLAISSSLHKYTS